MDKSQIRREIFKFRSSLSYKDVLDKSRIIFEKIADTDWYKAAQEVYLYASYNNEVDTRWITEYSLSVGKMVCCPKVNKTDENLCFMDFYEISSQEDLIAGYKGIPEPKDGLVKANEPSKNAIIIVPMVAFDEKRTRIGYGKGFYDRYLSTHHFHKIVGVAFEGQKVENITKNPFDISPEIIYTEINIY